MDKAETLSDKELYERFAAGDNTAFEALVLSHKDNLIYFLKRYVQDIHTCEDIAQDTFAAIFVYKDRYNYKTSFKTYLYAIAKNKAMDHIRKHSRLEPFGDEDLADEDDELFKRVVKKQEQIMVHKAIEKLRIDYQRVMILVDLEGLSYKEASDVLDKSVPQIKTLVFRARKALKNLLEKEGYTNED